MSNPKRESLRQRLDGDLHDWGDGLAGILKGLGVLGYNGVAGFLNGFMGDSSAPPQPLYWSKHRIQSLGRAISSLDKEYIIILENIYRHKRSYRDIQKAGICDKDTVKRRLDKAKEELLKMRYWQY